MKIYLAGPINGQSDDDCVNWRNKFKSAMPQHEYLDPMDRDYRGKESENYKEIVEADKADILACDCIFAYCPFPSVGTSMELLFAWENNKTSFVIVPKDKPVSPWLRYHATMLHFDLDRIIEVLKQATESIRK